MVKCLALLSLHFVWVNVYAPPNKYETRYPTTAGRESGEGIVMILTSLLCNPL